jgi:hypothetical protein
MSSSMTTNASERPQEERQQEERQQEERQQEERQQEERQQEERQQESVLRLLLSCFGQFQREAKVNPSFSPTVLCPSLEIAHH